MGGFRAVASVVAGGAILALAGAPAGAQASWPGQWTQTGMYASRNAVFGTGPGVSWSFNTHGPLKGQVSVVDGVAYVTTNGGRIYALDATTGKEIWMAKAGNKVMNAPIVVGSRVFVGEGNNQMLSVNPTRWIRGTGANGVIALDRGTGRLDWFLPTPGEVMGGLAYLDGTLYAADGSHWLYAIDPATGRVKWKVNDGGVDSMSSLAVAGGTIYVVTGGPADPSVKGFSAATGQETFSTVGHGNADNSPTVWDGIVFEENALPISDHGKLWFRDDIEAYGGSGRLLWHHLTGEGPLPLPPHPFATPPVTVSGGVVYAGSISSGKVYALKAQTGQLLWSQSVGAPTYAAPLVQGGRVYTTTKAGKILALDASTGRILGTLSVGGHFGPAYPVLVDGTLYVGNTDGMLYAVAVSRLAG